MASIYIIIGFFLLLVLVFLTRFTRISKLLTFFASAAHAFANEYNSVYEENEDDDESSVNTSEDSNPSSNSGSSELKKIK